MQNLNYSNIETDPYSFYDDLYHKSIKLWKDRKLTVDDIASIYLILKRNSCGFEYYSKRLRRIINEDIGWKTFCQQTFIKYKTEFKQPIQSLIY